VRKVQRAVDGHCSQMTPCDFAKLDLSFDNR